MSRFIVEEKNLSIFDRPKLPCRFAGATLHLASTRKGKPLANVDSCKVTISVSPNDFNSQLGTKRKVHVKLVVIA